MYHPAGCRYVVMVLSGKNMTDSLLHAEDKQFCRVLYQLFIYDCVYVLSSCHSQQRRDEDASESKGRGSSECCWDSPAHYIPVQ